MWKPHVKVGRYVGWLTKFPAIRMGSDIYMGLFAGFGGLFLPVAAASHIPMALDVPQSFETAFQGPWGITMGKENLQNEHTYPSFLNLHHDDVVMPLIKVNKIKDLLNVFFRKAT